MGKFNDKISAEYHPPRKWVLERALSYTNPDLDWCSSYLNRENYM